MISLINGHIQTVNNLPIQPLGYMEMYLNMDASVLAAPYGLVLGGTKNAVRFYFDSNCDIITPAQIWSNIELNPQNITSVGTWYVVNFYDSNGTRLNNAPMNWVFTEIAGSSVDIGTMTSINQGTAYYPTLSSLAEGSFSSPPPIGNVTPNTGEFTSIDILGAPSGSVVKADGTGYVSLGSAAYVATTTFDNAGAAATVQSNLNTEAATRAAADLTNANAISAETSRAEAAEALLAPNASPSFTGTVSVSGGQFSGPGTGLTGTAASLNIGGTAAGLSGTPTLPNGTLATTQTAGDNSSKVATTAYADAKGKVNSGGGGAIALYGSGTSTTVSPSPNIYTNGAAGSLYLGNPNTATSGTNYNSPSYALLGSYWAGTMGEPDNWSLTVVEGTGTNPTSTLTLSQSGSSGTASVSIPYLVTVSSLATSSLTIGGTSIASIYVPQTTTVNGHALSGNVTVSASDLTTGTLPHAQLPALQSGDIPANAANTSGIAALASNLTGTPNISVGTITATGAITTPVVGGYQVAGTTVLNTDGNNTNVSSQTSSGAVVLKTNGYQASLSNAGVFSASSFFTTGTVSAPNLITTSQVGGYNFRNRLYNGDHRVSQRNGTSTITLNYASGYATDRWNVASFGAASNGVLTATQVASSNPGFAWDLRIVVGTVRTSPAAADNFQVLQTIEGQNIADLAWGTSSAQSVTLSFWAYTTVAGNYCVALNGSTMSYVGLYSLTANSWQQVIVAIPGCTTGTWATDNTAGISIHFDMGGGSNFQTGTTGSWQTGGYYSSTGSVVRFAQNSGASFFFTGVQLEPGATVTPFERRPIGIENDLCARYYYRTPCNGAPSVLSALATGYQTSTTNTRGFFQFPVEMRTTPTLSAPVTLSAGIPGASATISAIADSYCTNKTALVDYTSGTQGSGSAPATIQTGASGGYQEFIAEF
jgi:hypothetical protein